ncbi:hypothetical protein G6F68_013150 [Rhizopus microsporus]|nr:hypothetical protein G6F67_009514 [Rhizopus microsporus]KAG1249770.1 hypothetical protein G6F68_013150 [Rhizopus microsporus]
MTTPKRVVVRQPKKDRLCGEAGRRSQCLSHAKRALYHLSYIPTSALVVSKRHKFLPTIPVRNKQRGPRLNPVTLKALKSKTRSGSRSFPFGMNAVRATKALAQLSKPS